VVLLPGESIAMYRDQGTPEEAKANIPEEATQETPTSSSVENAAPPEETVEPPAQETAGETQTATTVEVISPEETVSPVSPAEDTVADDAAETGKESDEKTEEEPEEAPETPVEEPSEDTAEPVTAEAESSLPESSPEVESPTGEATTDSDEDSSLDDYLASSISTGTRDELDDALTELQRFRSYEDEVGLPPSVRDRTADGVVWQDNESEDSVTPETTEDEEAVSVEAEATEEAAAAEDGEKKPATRRRRVTRGGRGRGTRSKSAADKTEKKDSEDEAPTTRSRRTSSKTSSRTPGRRSSTRGNGRRTSRSRTGSTRAGGDRPAPRRRTSARPSQGQPAIAELLKAGQEIIVQIAKAQIGQKGARITSHVTLPGRYLVYMPTIDHIGVSRKIGTADERARLRRTLIKMKGKAGGGFVVRTAAAECTDEELQTDVDYLVRLWYDMVEKAEKQRSPVILHQDLDLVQRLLRDQLSRSYENVWIDNEDEYTRVAEFVGKFLPKLSNKVKLYTREEDIFEEMGVQQEIDRALRPKVWLKSGGYIVVNQTEALVAIDINTGKFVGKGSTRLEDTIVKTNIEAVKEIVRQIRLRDLGGIIVIDFIDMEDRRNRNKVMRALESTLYIDRQPSKILPFNEFGLVAITRKRSKQSLERLLCQPCPYCTGTGMLRSIQTLCIEIQNEARQMALEMDAPELTIRANPDIVSALKGEVSGLVHELEEEFDKNIILQADESLHFEHYNIF
jgi:ribonuclease G